MTPTRAREELYLKKYNDSIVTPRKPAPYSNTDTAEVESTTIFQALLDQGRVKADIKERDKYPNIDGYLEIVSPKNHPIGKLEVQVKKLNEGYVDRPRYKLETSFFGYVMNVAGYPALIVSVDTINRKAYWFHVSEEYIIGLHLPPEQQTSLIEYPPENCIDGSNLDYIEKWTEVARNNKRKLLEHDELIKLTNIIRQKGNTIIGEKSTRINEINTFLDFFNMRLNIEFNIVKKVFYPNSWRIGLVFHLYEDECLVYSLYSVGFDENEVQIKYMEDNVTFRENSTRLSGEYRGNPIKNRPQSYAYLLIQDRLESIFDNKLLNNDNIFLSLEYIFAFLDIFHEQMGVEKKDIYEVNEIEYGLFVHLQMWVFEAVNFMVEVKRNGVRKFVDCFRGRPYLDPRSLDTQIMGDEMKLVLDRVTKKLEEKVQIPTVPVNNDRLPFGLLVDFISYLNFRGITEIKRPYTIKDNWGKSGWMWGQFSQENLRRNLTIFFDNLVSVYNELLITNFPLLQDELLLYKESKKVIVLYEDKEEYKSHEDAPRMEIYALYSDRDEEFNIRVMKKDEMPELDRAEGEGEVSYEGNEYTYRIMKIGRLDFIFNETPMLNYVYDKLWEKMKVYLASNM